jgi:hypothetical protein
MIRASDAVLARSGGTTSCSTSTAPVQVCVLLDYDTLRQGLVINLAFLKSERRLTSWEYRNRFAFRNLRALIKFTGSLRF